MKKLGFGMFMVGMVPIISIADILGILGRVGSVLKKGGGREGGDTLFFF